MLSSLYFLILGTIHNPLSDDYMMLQWAVGLFLASLIMAAHMNFRTRAFLPIFVFFYTMTSGCLTLAFRRTEPFIANATYASFSVFALTSLCLNLSFKRINKFFDAIAYLTIFNSLIVIVGAIVGTGKMPGSHGYIGLLNYSGMNGTLLAIGMPSLMTRFQRLRGSEAAWPWMLAVAGCLIAIGLSSSSIPFGVLVVACSAYLLHQRKYWIVALVPIVVLAVAFLIEREQLFDSAFRFDAYKIFMGEWIKRARWMWGTGLGTFQVIGPMIQKELKFMVTTDPLKPSHFWFWLHSDWLQCIFELGIAGFTLYALLFVDMLKRLWQWPSAELFAMTAALGSAALFDFPFRYFILAFLAGLLVTAVYRRD